MSGFKVYLLAALVAAAPSPAEKYQAGRSAHTLSVNVAGQSKGTTRLQNRIADADTGSGLTFEQDKPRVDHFASNLKKEPATKAYVIVYGGRRSSIGEANKRAGCIRNYLVRKHNITSERIVTVDGGYREEIAVELFAVQPDEAAPTPVPTVAPGDVRVVKIRKSKKRTCK